MAVFFCDTSAIVKRYANKTGSQWIDRVTAAATGNEIHVLRLTAIEMTSALMRRQRGGLISAADATSALADFRYDFANRFQTVEVTPGLLTGAESLIERHYLRGYDAVQLPAALLLESVRRARALPPLTVISADRELNAAARAEGLQVEDPNTHP